MGKFIGLKETPYSNFDERLLRRKVSTGDESDYQDSHKLSYPTLVPSFTSAESTCIGDKSCFRIETFDKNFAVT